MISLNERALDQLAGFCTLLLLPNKAIPFRFMHLRTLGSGEKRISRVFNRFRTLEGKTSGGGVLLPSRAPAWSEWVSRLVAAYSLPSAMDLDDGGCRSQRSNHDLVCRNPTVFISSFQSCLNSIFQRCNTGCE
jgi:hypothetical protein